MSDQSLRELIAEIDALAEKATPGEWEVSGTHIDVGHGDARSYIVSKHLNAKANIHLIAALVNNWPRLRDALKTASEPDSQNAVAPRPEKDEK